MSVLPTRSKDGIVARVAAGVQGRLASLRDFSVGSVNLALAEASAGVALWLQAVAVTVLMRTRAATSDDDDLDSFVGDFDVLRLGASPAGGVVTFGRFTAGPSDVVVPVGTEVATADGRQRFVVVPDLQLGGYVLARGGYVMRPGAASVAAAVSAVEPGRGGNVAAGTVTEIRSSVPGADYVINEAGFTNGLDAESDAALRARFVLFFRSLSSATPAALAYAAAALRQGLRVNVIENRTPEGYLDPGLCTVIVDDGSGAPPDALVQQVAAAVDAVRGAGMRLACIGAVRLPADLDLIVGVAPGFDPNTVAAAVAAALTEYVNGLPLGATLPLTRLSQIAYDVSAGVTNVTDVRINGAPADLVPSARETVKAAAVRVSPALA